MITFTRAHVRSLRRLLRETLGRDPLLGVTFLPLPGDHLAVRACKGQVALEQRLAGCSATGQPLTVPQQFLAACEGREPDLVRLTSDHDCATLQWHEGGIPQTATHPLAEPAPFPDLPAELAEVDPAFLSALAAACTCTDHQPSRIALGCLRVRGRAGDLAATDGRQLFLQKGLSLPFSEDLLVPALPVFRDPSLARARSLAVAQDGEWFSLRADHVTVQVRLQRQGRFPEIERVCQPRSEPLACLELSEADAAFLARSLPRLPGAREAHRPVTLDLNGRVAVRAQAQGDRHREARAPCPPPTELVLTSSSRTGTNLRVATDRTLLARALELGFRRFEFRDTLSPVIARAESRTYVWALLAPDRSLAPDPQATCLASSAEALPASRSASQPVSSQEPPMSATVKPRLSTPRAPAPAPERAAEVDNPVKPIASESPGPLAQAEALREALQRAQACARELVLNLRRERRHTRVVRETLASLRQLPEVI